MGHALIEKTSRAHKLTGAEAEAGMEELLSGRVETPEIVRMLAALNKRPHRPEALVGFARAMRRHAAEASAAGEERPERMVDTSGTGRDDTGAVNISPAAAIVGSAAGARMAKHKDRA